MFPPSRGTGSQVEGSGVSPMRPTWAELGDVPMLEPLLVGYPHSHDAGIGSRDSRGRLMTATQDRVGAPARVILEPAGRRRAGSVVVSWITTTDHKKIGNLYFITSFLYFLFGGLLGLVIRAELFMPGLQVVDNPEQYNQTFTMHGTIMLLLFATPLFAGFANALMPIQIGAPDVAFPRLNMFAYWLYLFGALIASSAYLTPNGAAAFGWFAYAPLSDTSYSPGLGGDLWVFGLALGGFGTILGAVNFITTIICLRAPGM